MIKKPNLNLAYALRTVQDNRNLYAAWAKDYETEFAHQMDYVLPQKVAEIFVEMAGSDQFLTSAQEPAWQVRPY